MIRVFFNTMPGVLSMVGMEPDSYPFDFTGTWGGRPYYLARKGPGWVLFKPSILGSSHVEPPHALPPDAALQGTPS